MTLCVRVCQEHVDVRVARIFNTFGPRMHMNDGRVVSNFILQALQDEDITVRYLPTRSTESVCNQGQRHATNVYLHTATNGSKNIPISQTTSYDGVSYLTLSYRIKATVKRWLMLMSSLVVCRSTVTVSRRGHSST